MTRAEFREAVSKLQKGSRVRVKLHTSAVHHPAPSGDVFIGKVISTSISFITLGVKGDGLRNFLFKRVESIEELPQAKRSKGEVSEVIQ